jgi:hypothetical protein
LDGSAELVARDGVQDFRPMVRARLIVNSTADPNMAINTVTAAANRDVAHGHHGVACS